jgi:hypothetical protein
VGCLDPKSNIIISSYVTTQTKRFCNACITRREKAEKKLSKVWSNADELLIDYAVVISTLAASKRQNSHSDSNAEKRSNERADKKRAYCEGERQRILKSMAKIVNEIRAEYEAAYNQMEGTAQILSSLLACYGQGLLMKPVYTHNLPVIDYYEDYAKKILTNHEGTWKAIISILKEVKE